MPERSTGSMMFIGERCALEECHREDFLPFKCSDCRHHFCSNHFRPQTHRCASYDQSGDYRVPLCPMCDNPPEGWRRDQDPNIAMDRHLSGQCPMLDKNGHVKSVSGPSTSAPMKRAKKTNECTFVKCSKIMVVPIQVSYCKSCIRTGLRCADLLHSVRTALHPFARLIELPHSTTAVTNLAHRLHLSTATQRLLRRAAA